MRDPVASFSNVPFGADLTVYLVVDGSGDRNEVNRERQIERPDLENVLSDLMAGLFHDPIRVVAFNTPKDISTDVAHEIQCRCDCDGLRTPQYLAGFMETHLDRAGRRVQRFVV